MRIRIDFDYQAIARRLEGFVSPERITQANRVGGRAAQQVIAEYYGSRGRALWINPSLPTHGPGRRRTRWWEQVARGWHMEPATPTGVTLSNAAPYLSHKVRGGTIRAKNARALTIPVHPAAHGRRAADFRREIAPLFRPRGTNVLAFKGAYGGVFSGDGAGRFSVAYVLRKSVYQRPWPGALPPTRGYQIAFARAFSDSIRGRGLSSR